MRWERSRERASSKDMLELKSAVSRVKWIAYDLR